MTKMQLHYMLNLFISEYSEYINPVLLINLKNATITFNAETYINTRIIIQYIIPSNTNYDKVIVCSIKLTSDYYKFTNTKKIKCLFIGNYYYYNDNKKVHVNDGYRVEFFSNTKYTKFYKNNRLIKNEKYDDEEKLVDENKLFFNNVTSEKNYNEKIYLSEKIIKKYDSSKCIGKNYFESIESVINSDFHGFKYNIMNYNKGNNTERIYTINFIFIRFKVIKIFYKNNLEKLDLYFDGIHILSNNYDEFNKTTRLSIDGKSYSYSNNKPLDYNSLHKVFVHLWMEYPSRTIKDEGILLLLYFSSIRRNQTEKEFLRILTNYAKLVKKEITYKYHKELFKEVFCE